MSTGGARNQVAPFERAVWLVGTAKYPGTSLALAWKGPEIGVTERTGRAKTFPPKRSGLLQIDLRAALNSRAD